MIGFIQTYWLEVIFSGILALFGVGYRQIASRIKKYEDLGEGVKALLYDRLRQSYNHHMNDGYITIDDFNYFNNLYESYHGLGGNGTGTEMKERLQELPPSSPR